MPSSMTLVCSSRSTSGVTRVSSRAWCSPSTPRRPVGENDLMQTRVVRVSDDTPVISDGSVVTIGAYDGVHCGHRKVLQLVRELADARDLEAVCVTFDRHPAQVVRPETAPALLTTLEHK